MEEVPLRIQSRKPCCAVLSCACCAVPAAFETLTDLAVRKKYLCAFKVLNRAEGKDGKIRALESWMTRYIGNKVKLLPKNVHGSSWVPRVLDNGRVKRTTQDK